MKGIDLDYSGFRPSHQFEAVEVAVKNSWLNHYTEIEWLSMAQYPQSGPKFPEIDLFQSLSLSIHFLNLPAMEGISAS